MEGYKSGFVAIIGKPNAGKSTLLNALLGEKLAIVSPKVQTTRHRIMGILTEETYQIIFSDTPGILEAKYKMQERMLEEIKNVRKDTDVILFLMDATDDLDENLTLLEEFKSNKPLLFVLNKMENSSQEDILNLVHEIQEKINPKAIIPISALEKHNLHTLLSTIVTHLPDNPPYYDEEHISDRPVRFFVEELIREKIFELIDKEIPYHSTVYIREYKEKKTLTKIVADIVVTRESQKGILIGKNGKMIQQIAELSRADIEKFIERKVFLELHIKVRKDWRNNDIFLREYGY